MEDKRNRSIKRKMRIEDDSMWDCSVCTFKNAKEAFKCEVCDTRKGTSTRKPRLNTQVVELQQQIQKAILKEKEDVAGKKKRDGSLGSKKDNVYDEDKSSLGRPPKLRNIDRSSARNYEITCNGVTVTITEFKPRWRSQSLSHVHPTSPSPSSCSSSMHGGLTSTPFPAGETPPTLPRGAVSPPNSLTGVPAALAASLPSPQHSTRQHTISHHSHPSDNTNPSPNRSGSTVAMSESGQDTTASD